jgi:hypothetical protein
VKRWVPKDIPQINTDFWVNKRIYCIAPSSLHGLGIFSMDGIKVCYNGITKLMEYLGPYYIYKDWIWLFQYKKSMRRHGMDANYIHLKHNNQHKGASMYIYGRPKTIGNIAGFIRST